MNICLLVCRAIIDLVPVHPVDSTCNTLEGKVLFCSWGNLQCHLTSYVLRDCMFHFLEACYISIIQTGHAIFVRIIFNFSSLIIGLLIC